MGKRIEYSAFHRTDGGAGVTKLKRDFMIAISMSGLYAAAANNYAAMGNHEAATNQITEADRQLQCAIEISERIEKEPQ